MDITRRCVRYTRSLISFQPSHTAGVDMRNRYPDYVGTVSEVIETGMSSADLEVLLMLAVNSTQVDPNEVQYYERAYKYAQAIEWANAL